MNREKIQDDNHRRLSEEHENSSTIKGNSEQLEVWRQGQDIGQQLSQGQALKQTQEQTQEQAGVQAEGSGGQAEGKVGKFMRRFKFIIWEIVNAESHLINAYDNRKDKWFYGLPYSTTKNLIFLLIVIIVLNIGCSD